jgi:hypothetical protein
MTKKQVRTSSIKGSVAPVGNDACKRIINAENFRLTQHGVRAHAQHNAAAATKLSKTSFITV